MKISEVKEILAGEPDPDQVAELAADERSGVQKLVAAYHKRQEKLRLEQQRFTEMLAYERKYYAQGAQYIAGIDEAGRGPLAGPLVIAAVILPQEVFISGLNDSKQLSAVKREQLYEEIITNSIYSVRSDSESAAPSPVELRPIRASEWWSSWNSISCSNVT